ncbi:hypothetical protein KYB31_14900 [Clostridium felsineum]|uniref:hypothetical protein n=1 Tax=Clostridium felsineum TaxID=36839 RepID=UPI00214DAFC2|nr:hypothetical protein [Clostridium felsineum]MCR3760265.1 hypothetical protein [Clostridium felsineum]
MNAQLKIVMDRTIVNLKVGMKNLIFIKQHLLLPVQGMEKLHLIRLYEDIRNR